MSDTKFEWTDEYVLEWGAYLSKKRAEWAALHNNRAADPPDIFILNEFKASKCPDNTQWQILLFRGVSNTFKDVMWVRCDDGYYKKQACHYNNKWDLISMLNSGSCVKSGEIEIYSVKRVSDGEVFTIGETFLSNAGCDLTIKGFTIRDTGELLVDSVEYGYFQLESITHKTKPLFTTTDDVMIYEGMTYWTVDKDFSFYFSGAADEGSGSFPNKKYFHTEKAMHNWIYENKPIYSVKDFREIIKAFEERIAPKTPQ